MGKKIPLRVATLPRARMHDSDGPPPVPIPKERSSAFAFVSGVTYVTLIRAIDRGPGKSMQILLSNTQAEQLSKSRKKLCVDLVISQGCGGRRCNKQIFSQRIIYFSFSVRTSRLGRCVHKMLDVSLATTRHAVNRHLPIVVNAVRALYYNFRAKRSHRLNISRPRPLN